MWSAICEVCVKCVICVCMCGMGKTNERAKVKQKEVRRDDTREEDRKWNDKARSGGVGKVKTGGRHSPSGWERMWGGGDERRTGGEDRWLCFTFVPDDRALTRSKGYNNLLSYFDRRLAFPYPRRKVWNTFLKITNWTSILFGKSLPSGHCTKEGDNPQKAAGQAGGGKKRCKDDMNIKEKETGWNQDPRTALVSFTWCHWAQKDFPIYSHWASPSEVCH